MAHHARYRRRVDPTPRPQLVIWVRNYVPPMTRKIQSMIDKGKAAMRERGYSVVVWFVPKNF